MSFLSLPQHPKDNKKKDLFNLDLKRSFFKSVTSSSSFTSAVTPLPAGPNKVKNIPISEVPQNTVENEDIGWLPQVSVPNAGKLCCASER
jgi:hypothetical protein